MRARWSPRVVLCHVGGPEFRVHLPGRLREDVPGLHEGLEVSQHSWPSGGGRVVFSSVGQVLVGDGESADLPSGLYFERYPRPPSAPLPPAAPPIGPPP